MRRPLRGRIVGRTTRCLCWPKISVDHLVNDVYSVRVLKSRKEEVPNLLLVLPVQQVLGHHPDHGVRTQHVPFELPEEVAEEVDQACH